LKAKSPGDWFGFELSNVVTVMLLGSPLVGAVEVVADVADPAIWAVDTHPETSEVVFTR
jgi:hypothetical protein